MEGVACNRLLYHTTRLLGQHGRFLYWVVCRGRYGGGTRGHTSWGCSRGHGQGVLRTNIYGNGGHTCCTPLKVGQDTRGGTFYTQCFYFFGCTTLLVCNERGVTICSSVVVGATYQGGTMAQDTGDLVSTGSCISLHITRGRVHVCKF